MKIIEVSQYIVGLKVEGKFVAPYPNLLLVVPSS
jgi:hypothetical protein